MIAREMEAGRVLDGIIGERIMDYQGVGYYGPTKSNGMHQDYVRVETWAEAKALYDRYWAADTVEAHVHEDIYQWEDGWGPLMIPEFSGNMLDAWVLVEEMRSARFQRWLYLSEHSDGWRAVFSSTIGQAPLHAVGSAPSPELAICRAALVVVGAE